MSLDLILFVTTTTMAEGKHHHGHLFNRHKEEAAGKPMDYKKEAKHHQHKERIGKLGAAAAGAYALVSNSSTLTTSFQLEFNCFGFWVFS